MGLRNERDIIAIHVETFHAVNALADHLDAAATKYTEKYGKKKSPVKRFGELVHAHTPGHHDKATQLHDLSQEMHEIAGEPELNQKKVLESLTKLYGILDSLSAKKGRLKTYLGEPDRIDKLILDVIYKMYPDIKEASSVARSQQSLFKTPKISEIWSCELLKNTEIKNQILNTGGQLNRESVKALLPQLMKESPKINIESEEVSHILKK